MPIRSLSKVFPPYFWESPKRGAGGEILPWSKGKYPRWGPDQVCGARAMLKGPIYHAVLQTQCKAQSDVPASGLPVWYNPVHWLWSSCARSGAMCWVRSGATAADPHTPF